MSFCGFFANFLDLDVALGDRMIEVGVRRCRVQTHLVLFFGFWVCEFMVC